MKTRFFHTLQDIITLYFAFYGEVYFFSFSLSLQEVQELGTVSKLKSFPKPNISKLMDSSALMRLWYC